MFFCLWIPQFAAWALEQSEPSLTQRPFVVSQNGKVVAVSPMAQAVGITEGMTDAQAKSRAASLLVVQRDPSIEALVWGEVQKAVYGLTPQIEAISPGLLFADLKAEKILPMLRQWNIFGGLGRDRATAQLAALSANRGSALCIRDNREAPFADRIPLEASLQAGISPKSLQRLQRSGWKSVGALRHLSRRQLEEQLGADGLTLFRLAQGPLSDDNLRGVASWTPPEELSAALSFEVPAREPDEWEGTLDQIVLEACRKLDSRSARTLEIRIETPLQPLTARCILKEPVTLARLPLATARAVLAEALESLAPLPPVVAAIEVRLGALSTSPSPGLLPHHEKVEKASRFQAALKGIETRLTRKAEVQGLGQIASPFAAETYQWRPALEAARFLKQNPLRPALEKITKLSKDAEGEPGLALI